MKAAFTILLSFLTFAASATIHVLTPDSISNVLSDHSGHIVKSNWYGYSPGDLIYLRGHFKTLIIDSLVSNGYSYLITNYPGEALTIGDSTWDGGAWAKGLQISHSKGLVIFGESRALFRIIGSKGTTVSFGAPSRTAYVDFGIMDLSSNMDVHTLTIREGGAGLFCKSEVESGNSATWYPNTFMDHFNFYDLEICNTYNEAMYIGHTATKWYITGNYPYYPSSKTDRTAYNNPSEYKWPVKLRYVKIYNNIIHHIGNDAIQCAAIDSLEVFNNEIYYWATKHGVNDNGGILIGGRCIGFLVHDNYLHDGGKGGSFTNGWGEPFQIYAGGGGAIDSIYNNLVVRNDSLDVIDIRLQTGVVYCEDSTEPRVVFKNNTVASFLNGSGSHECVRVNGYFSSSNPIILTNNILIGTYHSYYYTENGGTYYSSGDFNFATVGESGLDSTDNWQGFLTTSGYGYKYDTVGVNNPPTANSGSDQTITLPTNNVLLVGDATDTDGTIASYSWTKQSGGSATIVSPGSISTTITGLTAGVYVFRLTVTDNEGATGYDDVTVTVNAATGRTEYIIERHPGRRLYYKKN